MSLSKAYEPKKHEGHVYRLWEKSGAFAPAGRGEPFAVIMPPPNANGKLHWGHAIGYTTEDIVIRYKRMRGYRTLWLPGTDHAGIETQFVYERDILSPQGKTRFDIGPEQFYRDVMEYTRAASTTIIDQFKSMGFSADWQKLKFTLDEDIIDIVYDTFIKLHADGHVYRGNRIVNWCPRCQAAFADIELEREERKDLMYTLDYGPIQIATVRPETIFADVAVAVNPKDRRLSGLVGKEATVPLVERAVPIIADHRVEIEQGTGALKITPGHDPLDYEIGLEAGLPEISVIDMDGRLVNVPEQFAGLSVEAGREAVVGALKKAGKLVHEEQITHAVAVHDRCGSVIEPLISEQWFLRIKALNRPVIEAFKSGEIEVFPKRFTKIALNWLEQERDWCISRQIWWGIRIPVYYKTSNDPGKEPYIIAKTEAEARDYYGEGNYRAETDTFDTWFSSGQWPFATLMTTGGFEEFYPTSLMGTAREILHKWVTRMVMFGLYRTGKVPFKQVYLWGLVTDEHGAKMSKSKGNTIDPLAITEKYGTDALRLAGAISNTPGNDSPMSEKRVEAMRNFCNKLWNVARFITDKLDGSYAYRNPVAASSADSWILARLNHQTAEISKLIESYRMNEAANLIYHLLWDDFADWYIEASKVSENKDVLVYGLATILKLAHPFTPFVTEAIWQQLPAPVRQAVGQELLLNTPWPQAHLPSAEAAGFEQVQRLVIAIRNIKATLQLKPPVLYCHKSTDMPEPDLVVKLAGLEKIKKAVSPTGLPLLVDGVTYWLEATPELVKTYARKLELQAKELETTITRTGQRLKNKPYLQNAPAALVEETRQQLAAAQTAHDQLLSQLEQLRRG